MIATSVKLGDVCEIVMGQAPSGESYNDVGDGFPLIAGAGDFKNGVIKVGKFTTKPTKISIKNDIVMSIRASIGDKVYVDEGYCLGRGVAAVRASNKINRNYLWHVLTHVEPKLISKGRGATFLQVNKDDIQDLEIPLPLLAEQKRIAALLDTADNIMRLREQAIAKLDELVLSKFSEIEVNVKEHIELEKIVVKPKVESKLTSEKVWSLSLDQIESQTGKLIDKVFVDKNDLGTSTFFFKPPVVLYSKLRPYLNKVYIPDSEGYATTELIPLYCNKDLVLPEYLALMLMSKKFVEYATVNSGGAKMPRMMMDKFWNYPVPLANMSVQQNIAKIYNQIKSAKKVMELDLQKLHNLNSSLQHQSFAVN